MKEQQMILDPVIESNLKKYSSEREDILEDRVKELKSFLLDDFKFLKDNKRKHNDINFKNEYNKKSHEAFTNLSNFLKLSGAEMVSDVGEVYYYYINGFKKLAVRKDDPERVVNLVGGNNIKLNFDPKVSGDGGNKYANCAIWPDGPNSMNGIVNAFVEGFLSAGPISTVVAINYENSNKLTLEDAKDKLMHSGDLNRNSVRVLSGEITLKDLEFVIVRIVRRNFAEELMTEREKKDNKREDKDKPPYIFRGFVFSEKLKNIVKNKN